MGWDYSALREGMRGFKFKEQKKGTSPSIKIRNAFLEQYLTS